MMQQYILLYSALFIVSTDTSDIFPFLLFCIDLLHEKHSSPSLPPKKQQKQQQQKQQQTTSETKTKQVDFLKCCQCVWAMLLVFHGSKLCKSYFDSMLPFSRADKRIAPLKERSGEKRKSITMTGLEPAPPRRGQRVLPRPSPLSPSTSHPAMFQ